MKALGKAPSWAEHPGNRWLLPHSTDCSSHEKYWRTQKSATSLVAVETAVVLNLLRSGHISIEAFYSARAEMLIFLIAFLLDKFQKNLVFMELF